MNLSFNILHVDDNKEFINGTEDLLIGLMKNYYLLPHVDRCYSYDMFKKDFIDKIDEFDFVKYDLVLVDYMLSDSSINGMDVIREIRRNNIYTDIIFYSSSYAEMRKSIKDELSDDEFVGGVYYCDKEELNDKIMDIVNKNMKKAADITNIRGLIIDATSNFDVISKDICEIMFDSLNKDLQEEAINILNEGIEKAEKRVIDNFKRIKHIKDHKEKLIKTLNNVYYVMDNKDKYKVFEYIVNNAKSDNDFSSDEYNNCNVIKHRNIIAHQYITICKNYKKLLVDKSVVGNKKLCNEDCSKCVVGYSYQDLIYIRESLFEYFSYFEKIKDELLLL